MAFSVAPDTCVLYPAHRRDTLLRLAESSLYRPLWSSEILAELDLAALIARAPELALVDELAHTNAPGSKHSKRFEDVEELIRAGIHVITTVNVQHLESLYDEVERSTGVKVKEPVAFALA